MISNDGTMVCAVVCMAPLTIPSAMPRWTIMAPKYETSLTMSAARSSVIPLCARSRAYSLAKRSTRSGSFGDRILAPAMSTPAMSTPAMSTPPAHALARTTLSSPRSVRSATRSRSRLAAARRIRSSSPSGSTMCLRLARARAISRYWNISGVGTSDSATSLASSTASPSTDSANTRSAVSSFTRDAAVNRPCTPAGVHGRLTAASRVKLETALRVFAESVDGEAVLDASDVAESDVPTPLMFQYRLIARARANRRHIVLPEGEDERILRAAASLLRLRVADLTLLGEDSVVRAKASAAGVDITGARILSPKDPDLVDRFAKEYARLRAHKGMIEERAADIVSDVSYFGAMMVHLGMADGMVSGAMHTTAHTIRPSFEIIKTALGTAIVSSVFLMCLSDRVLVYGDCAVIPDPCLL